LYTLDLVEGDNLKVGVTGDDIQQQILAVQVMLLE
jgi:hypothetical protein